MTTDLTWAAIPPAQATIQCGDAVHRLRWDAGTLTAPDHADLNAERTLAALSGQPCACADLLDAWARHSDDLHVLLLASRGTTDPLTPAPPHPSHTPPANLAAAATPIASARGWTSYATLTAQRIRPSAPARRRDPSADAADELATLLGLGGGLPDRLVATVAHAWRQRLERPRAPAARARVQLHAALYGRLLSSLRTWLGQPDLELDLTVTDDSGLAALSMVGDGRIRAELPFSWLSDVWCRGLATVWARFCLGATTDDGHQWTLLTTDPGLRPAQPITINLAP